MVVQILRWQFTVADFARMTAAGIFAEDDRLRSTTSLGNAGGSRHASCVTSQCMSALQLQISPATLWHLDLLRRDLPAYVQYRLRSVAIGRPWVVRRSHCMKP
jgi:hypothetical protein